MKLLSRKLAAISKLLELPLIDTSVRAVGWISRSSKCEIPYSNIKKNANRLFVTSRTHRNSKERTLHISSLARDLSRPGVRESIRQGKEYRVDIREASATRPAQVRVRKVG